MQITYRITKLPKKKLYYSAVAVAIGLCIIGGSVWKLQAQPQTAPPDIPLVRTTVVGTANTAQSYLYSGEVRGRYETQKAFQVSGKIIKRNVDAGSTVKSGDVLMQIDARDLQQSVNSASAQVNSAESQLRLAENNLSRYRQLYEQSAISRAQLAQYENAYAVAQAMANQATAQYAQGANQLDYSRLYADKDGIISSVTAETGQVVGAGQTVITLVQEGEHEIEINIPENRIEELRSTPQLSVTFWALPNIAVEGKIREVAPMADAITRTYKVRVSLINPPPQVKLGMTAGVRAASVNNTNISLPLSALYQTDGTPCVWVVTEHTVALRPIQIGNFINKDVQVLGGLQSGDTVVTAGVHKLREGQRVKLMEGELP